MRVLALLLLVACTNEPAPDPTLLEQLEAEATAPTSIARTADGRARSITTRVSVTGATPHARATDFLERYGSLLGVDRADLVIRPQARPDPDGSGDTVVYDGTQDGRPVWGSQVIVHVEGDQVTYVAAGVVPDPSAPLGDPVLDETQALAAAREALKLPTAILGGSGQLVGYNPGLFSGRRTSTHLAWTMLVRGPALSNTHVRVFVDAQSGSILAAHDRHPDGYLEKTRSLAPVDISTAESWEAYLANAELQYTEDGLVSGVVPTDAATAMHSHLQSVYTYLDDTHGRDSLDDMGLELVSYVDYTDDLNAFWDGENALMVFHPDLVAADVTAHELVHGMVQYTAALEYMGQSGALNESMADVFGAFVDGNWTMGEATATGTLRDLVYPPAELGEVDGRQPHHMAHFYDPATERTCASDTECGELACIGGFCTPWYSEDTDYHGVHINSGIPNHAVYLASVGGTHTVSGITVQSIGVEKVAHVVYRTLTNYLHASSVFLEYRTGVRRSALDMIEGTGAAELTYEECGHLLDAFAAVGIGAEDRDHDCFDDDEDNCPCVYNPEQNADACAGMDACEPVGDCESSADCAGGQECSPAGRCVEPMATPWDCTTTSDCPEGTFCLAGGICQGALDDSGCQLITTESDCNGSSLACGWCPDVGCLNCDRAGECGGVVEAICNPVDDPCNMQVDCDSCTQEPNCGWCDGACVGAEVGCAGDFAVERSACVDCSGHMECGSCAGDGFCSWCPSSGGCINDSLTFCEGAIAIASMCSGG